MPGFKNKITHYFGSLGQVHFTLSKIQTLLKIMDRVLKGFLKLGLSVIHTSADITANLFLLNVWYITLFSELESIDSCSLEAVC